MRVSLVREIRLPQMGKKPALGRNRLLSGAAPGARGPDGCASAPGTLQGPYKGASVRTRSTARIRAPAHVATALTSLDASATRDGLAGGCTRRNGRLAAGEVVLEPGPVICGYGRVAVTPMNSERGYW